jgi:hypothetical protein
VKNSGTLIDPTNIFGVSLKNCSISMLFPGFRHPIGNFAPSDASGLPFRIFVHQSKSHVPECAVGCDP